MKFTIAHSNINVKNLDVSIDFYKNALGLREQRRINAPDGSFILAFLGDDITNHQIELTWLRDKEGSYDLGDNESHIAFRVDDIEEAHKRHEKMNCICYENKEMGIYFISDPDGYWLEIIPTR